MTESNVDPRYVDTHNLVRRRHRSHKSPKSLKQMFINGRLPDILLLLLIIVAGLALIKGLSLEAGSVAGSGSELVQATRTILFGLPAFTIGVFLGTRRLRWRINRYEGWWNTHCPDCQSKELKRTHRRSFDRLLGWLGIPVRRYICADCQWEGRRIDPWRVF
ncbi:MAG: hypothetical protein KDE56_13330 [Anaerolineales bacterium]|nr:hypothetical protein [Anaerolineales bacterium]